MTKKRWLIIGLIVIIAITAGALAWWYAKSNSETTTDDRMSDDEVKLLNYDRDLSSPEEAKASFEDQVKLRDQMSSASDSDRVVYYNYMMLAGSQAGLCDEATEFGRELEQVDIVGAFNNYRIVINCYNNQGNQDGASKLEEYIQDNLDKLPEASRDQFREGQNK